MKAVSKFKRLVDPSKAVIHSILGSEHDSQMVQPPLQIEPYEGTEAMGVFKRVINEDDLLRRSSTNTSQESFSERGRSPRRHGSGVADKQTRSVFMKAAAAAAAVVANPSAKEGSPSRSTSEGTRGHARNPLEEEVPYLHIGPSTFTGDFTNNNEYNSSNSINNDDQSNTSKQRPILLPLSVPDTSINGIPEFPQTGTPIDTDQVPIISESPGASEIDIYETAYREEIERIKRRSLDRRDSAKTRVYLTRRVERQKKHLDEVLRMVSAGSTREQHQHDNNNDQDHSSDSVVLHGVSDKVSNAFASAGVAFSNALAAAKGATSTNISSTSGFASKEEGKDGEGAESK